MTYIDKDAHFGVTPVHLEDAMYKGDYSYIKSSY